MKKDSTIEIIKWVEELQAKCDAAITPAERREQHKYATLIQNPEDKVFLSKLLDESSQIRSQTRLSKRVKYLIDTYGIPGFFSAFDRFLMRVFRLFGYWVPLVAIPIFKFKLREDTRAVIIDEKRPSLTKHLDNRYKKQVGQNVNLLGEVVLSNHEADIRYEHYLDALQQPDINYISIKLSGIYSQMHPLNFEEAKRDLRHRLITIYQKAIDNPYTDSTGVTAPKFVNLDMEEYKDAHLTLEMFMEVLSLPQFKDYHAGIVIQAYLNDAWDLQTDLINFARKRVSEGGSPLKMRLVKGANLQMESVISSLRGWPNPVRSNKVEVDANYLHLLERALEPENAKALHVGVASHNLFTIGFAHWLSLKNGVEEYVTFEMLEGMANHLWRTMKDFGHQVILYTPVVSDAHFLNAVSYLVRRLDENTGEENFLSYSFNLKVGSEQWNFLRKQFEEAMELKDKVTSQFVRVQNRNESYPAKGVQTVFENEPDTDFDLPVNKQWAVSIAEKWKKSSSDVPTLIPVQIGSEEVVVENRQQYIDHNQQDEPVCVYEMGKASIDQVASILEVADKGDSWSKLPLSERTAILHKTADLLADRRGDLIGCMCAVTGKTITEGDVEVSEAIDFCRFYPLTMGEFESLPNVSVKEKGVVLVISPWNFPLAIPVGGVSSALSGGNRVILKPATVSAPVAWEFAKAFWDAGVPREALQVVICDGREGLNLLTKSPIVKHTILTGGTDTAQQILKNNPQTPLSAETGGKNAIILTGSGDRDKAIMNVMTSAFGNAGQKCSACSLLLVEKEVFDDPSFKGKVRDAATSIKVGFNWDLGNVVGGMITNRNDKLEHAIAHPEPGTEWLVPPRFLDKEKYVLAPTILWDVKPDGYSFRTELFAPFLSVVRVDSLQHAIDLVNSLDFGLTSGLQSLDEREQALWKNSIEAGNLYINRGITGAIVNRQPFGGMKLSAFGGGIKAGGVNYVSCFVEATDKKPLSIDAVLQNYKEAAEKEFLHPRDVNHLFGEQNLFRYLPLKKMVLRVFENDTVEDIIKVSHAAKAVGTPLTISIHKGDVRVAQLEELAVIKEESLSDFYKSILQYDRIRTLSPDIPMEMFERAAEANKYIAFAPVVSEGRMELLHYVKEQSISFEYHRYGSIAEVPAVE